MKKNFNTFLAACAAFAMVFSCTKAENPVSGTQDGGNYVSEPLGQVTVSAVLSNPMTKVAFDPTVEGGKPTALALTWEAGDQLCVYDAANKENKATLELDAASIGQKTGIFTGNVNFSASSYYVEVLTAGEVADYAAQTQPADGQTKGLKYRAYANTANLTSLEFVNYTTPLAITAMLPSTDVVAAVESVTITASEAIFNGGSTLTVNLSEKGDANGDGILHLYVNLPEENPAIAEGTSLLVKFNTPSKADHTVYTRYVELGAASFEAGKLNTININASESDVHAGAKGCTGAEGSAYLVGDKYQMQAVNSLLSADALKYVQLVDDIDLKDVAWTSNAVNVNLNGNNHTISNYSSNNGFFENLKGNVQDLKFDSAVLNVTNIAGLLADVAENVIVKNVTITNSTVISTKGIVGGLFGQLNSGTVEDVNVACTINGTQQLGGVVGLMQSGSLTNCHSTETVDGNAYYLGGLVGIMDKGTITNCSASGNVTCASTSTNYVRTGGLVGQINGTGKTEIKDSYATGDVDVYGRLVGGLIGYMAGNVEIDGCYALGKVTSAYVGEVNLGGLIGEMNAGTVKNSYYSLGSITSAGQHTGGLIGRITGTSEITSCYSTGDVTCTNAYNGGFIGTMTDNVVVGQCYSTGAVKQTNNANFNGGFIGQIQNATTTDVTISNCYASGAVSGKNYCGGFTGTLAGKVSITDCFSCGTIAGGAYSASVFSGSVTKDKLTLNHFIGWNVSNRSYFYYGQQAALDGNYMGKDGTISAKAKEFGWDETIWDLSKDVPTLKCFAK